MARLNPSHTDCSCTAHTADARLALAQTLCARKGLRLTQQRRIVLEALLESKRALGAYDLIERVSARAEKRVAPVTIYRALEFLTENDLVHRIESQNAFLACPGGHGAHPQAVFLICESCGHVTEAAGSAVEAQLRAIAAQAGFTPRGRVIELTGLCADCAPKSTSTVPQHAACASL